MKIKSRWWFGLLILIAFLGRILLTTSGVHGDLIMQAGWGQWIFLNHGFRGFYENMFAMSSGLSGREIHTLLKFPKR